MSYSTYEIWLRDNLGNRLALIDSETLLSLSLARSIYGEGAVDITCKAAFPFAYIQQDGQLEIYRMWHQDGTITTVVAVSDVLLLESGSYLLLEDGSSHFAFEHDTAAATTGLGTTVIPNFVTGTIWLITKFAQEIHSSSLPYFHIMAEPMVSILKRRIVANAADSSQASKTAAGDDMMKAIMREQYGASATDSTRDISAYLTVAADTTAGVSMTKAFSWRDVYSVLSEISQDQAQAGTRIYFDITYDVNANMATFYTYVGQRGTDHTATSSAPVVFSYDRDNMQDPSLTYDYTSEHNYIYTLGQGLAGDRLVVTAEDAGRIAASVWNLRENQYNASNYSTTVGLSNEANSQLWAGRPKVTISGQLLSVPGYIFGVDWDFGDLVTAEFDTVSQSCLVESVSIQLGNGMEQISGTARGI